jgi:hypothetical protein
VKACGVVTAAAGKRNPVFLSKWRTFARLGTEVSSTILAPSAPPELCAGIETVIASEAKQSTLSFLLPDGLLRFARNDGVRQVDRVLSP